jgi:hypothetical protein
MNPSLPAQVAHGVALGVALQRVFPGLHLGGVNEDRNLVSSTQVSSDNKYNSYADPTDEVCDYLHPDLWHYFTFRTWERLVSAVV